MESLPKRTRAAKKRTRADFNKKYKNGEDTRLSVCSECRRGIFMHHKYYWSGCGFIHEDCKKKDIDAIKTAA